MDDEEPLIEIEVYCGDELVAGCSGPWREAINEALHYASQCAEDGPVTFQRIMRQELLMFPSPVYPETLVPAK